MNLRFIGSPCSGKTTTAAMVFAKLKESGISVEFIPEYARLYIAGKRLEKGLQPYEQLTLNDEDQIKIFKEQASLEYTMATVCGKSVNVIGDTWSLAAFLYMSSEAREYPEVQEILQTKVLPTVDVVFYVPPFQKRPSSDSFGLGESLDPNRIHTHSESLRIDLMIPEILARYAPKVRVVPVAGRPEARSSLVLKEVFDNMKRFTDGI